jgi:hypothetical protein
MNDVPGKAKQGISSHCQVKKRDLRYVWRNHHSIALVASKAIIVILLTSPRLWDGVIALAISIGETRVTGCMGRLR